MSCPCLAVYGPGPWHDDDRHSPAAVALARRLAELYQGANPTPKQIGWFIEDAVTVIAALGPGPFEVIENAEGLDPDGLDRHGFDGTAFIVDDTWFAVLTELGGSVAVRLTESESLRLWQVSVGEVPTDA